MAPTGTGSSGYTTRSEEDRLGVQQEEDSIEIHTGDDDPIEEHAQVLILPELTPHLRPLTPLVVARQPPVPALRAKVPVAVADE